MARSRLRMPAEASVQLHQAVLAFDTRDGRHSEALAALGGHAPIFL